MRALLDMDGVLADFVTGVSAAHGRPSPYENGEGRGIFDMEKLWDISSTAFWKPTNSSEFWLNLPKMADADALVEFVMGHFGEDNVAVLTAPSLFDGCMAAKRDWVAKHYPALTKRVIFAPAQAKSFLACPDNLLIDDRNENVDRFLERGGHAVLVPRPWNRAHAFSHLSVAVVQRGCFVWSK